MNLEYPQRPREHEVGDRAVNVLKVRIPRRWATNESKSDYGWDILVNISEEAQVREDFFVQLKGSDNPTCIDNGRTVSVSLKITTVNFLLDKPMPSMLCICDTGKENEPVFYVWLQEEISRIEKRNPNWRTQKSLVFRIPISQVLDEHAHRDIEQYVRQSREHLRISAAIGEMLCPALGFKESSFLSPFTSEARKVVSEKVSSVVKESGIAEVTGELDKASIKPLSTEDQERLKKIKKSSASLDELRDDDAKAIIDKLEPEIEEASDGIAARFYNNKGVLALYQRDYEGALGCFKKAHILIPDEPKYATNCLFAEYLLALPDTDGRRRKFPDGWSETLEKILAKHKELPGALRLKAIWLSATKSAGAAEEYLRKTKLWKDKSAAVRKDLAEEYADEGDWDKSIQLLQEVKQLGDSLDGVYWGLLGNVLLHKALGSKRHSSSFVVYGPGPSELDLTRLKKAEKCLYKSCEKFAAIGFPLISSMAVVNFTVVQRILGNTDDAKHFCKSFLMRHKNHPDVVGALAGCLMAKDEVLLAARYAKIAYDANPTEKHVYQNHLVCLYMAEDSETLLELVAKRESIGFSDTEEESLSFALRAVALNEIGQGDKATKQIAVMKKNPNMVQDAIVSEAVIAQNNGLSKEEIAAIYRKGLKLHPDSSLLLTHLIQYLDPSNADQARELTDCIKMVVVSRQLVPLEIYKLGLCYLTLEKHEDALAVFKNGETRYPTESRFLYGQAMASSALGDDEGAYVALVRYLELGRKDYNVLRNLAFAALETDRMDEAIQLFQKTLAKADKADERGELHCQLWELKRQANKSPKELLRHVIGFGKSVGSDTAKEARFLMMALLTPASKEEDSEITEWNKDIRKRLKTFAEKYPKFPGFRTLKIPADVPEKERGAHILAQIAEIMLPHRLAAAALTISSRGVPYPLSFRAALLPGISSIFEFWSECTASRSFSHGIHIWFDSNPMDAETKCVSERNKVCADLTALLTLAELDLLDLLKKNFNLIIMARGTKRAIDSEFFSHRGPHPLAEKINKWRLKNRSMIRIRSIASSAEHVGEDAEYERGPGGIYVEGQKSIDDLIGDGVGESVLLANNLNVPLYSDESFMRKEALDTYKVNGFSTISLTRKMRYEGHITIGKETAILCEMIRKNYRVIPFDKEHLTCCLNEVILTSNKTKEVVPTTEQFLMHKDMGTLLRQFGDPFFAEAWLAQITVEWWLSLIENRDVSNEILVKCMEYPSYALSMRTTSQVISKVKKYEQEDRLAHIFAFFLMKACELKDGPVAETWSAITSCCARIFYHAEERYKIALFHMVPRWLIKEVSEINLSDDDKLMRVVMISSCLPEEDRQKIDRVFMKLNSRFMRS